MILFTGDQHFGHHNIIRHCGRPFASVEEMDETLIENWNRAVKPADTVYILGDIFFRNYINAEDYLVRLNGKKRLIVGNHDKEWMKKTDMGRFFESVDRFAEISDGSHKITLCHYPMMTWDRVAQGGYMIHAHIHNDRSAIYFPVLCQMPNLLNAGVDINKMHPVHFEALKKNNMKFKEGSMAQ
jgi:calcineurin-like phosphoesterase family protein